MFAEPHHTLCDGGGVAIPHKHMTDLLDSDLGEMC